MKTYESWRCTYQSSEAAALAAYDTAGKLHAELTELREQIAAIGAGGVEPLRPRRFDPGTLLEELGFVLEERAGVWVVQEDAGGCHPANLTERVLWKALVEMHQPRQCLHQISEPNGEYLTLPEPAFQLRWHGQGARYTVSKPNIGDTDVFTAEQMRAYVDADRAMRAQAAPAESVLIDGIAYDTPAPVAREPLTDDAIVAAFCETPGLRPQQMVSCFVAGARFSEARHGIT